MQIAKNTVVTLSYKVHDMEGNLIDAGEHPMIYVHGGYDGIFPALEEALHGKEVGASLELKLLPEEAFGDYDAALVNVEPRNLFPDELQVGMQFERAAEDGEEDVLYTITEIAEDKVVIDGNHPLAGMALLFACTVDEVRLATPEELAHGHAHGHDHDHEHGGHHH